MVLTLYGAWDNLAHNFITFTVTPKNDGLAVRNVLSTLRVPLKDSQLIVLGEFDTEIGFHSFKSSLRSVDWSVYKFPENIADAISPLGLSETELSECLKNINKD